MWPDPCMNGGKQQHSTGLNKRFLVSEGKRLNVPATGPNAQLRDLSSIYYRELLGTIKSDRHSANIT
jgi:hypothetical protein